ncbi:uncharacterized protein LOC134814492 [Bolinopsis microptera]|uniref:uncharacterized protein LOC134814492 n=1 Tax=Bolinopsis microptera TaxID=2820187 RepID=UPI00307A7610
MKRYPTLNWDIEMTEDEQNNIITCKTKFENVWEHKAPYYCTKQEECCSTELNWHGCCPKPIWGQPTIQTEYIVAIAAVVCIIILLIFVGICVMVRKRRKHDAPHRTLAPFPSAPPLPSAPPYPGTSPEPEYSQGKPPSYSEACPENMYHFSGPV